MLCIAVAALGLPGVAHAAPPDNDDFDKATVIGALPHSGEQELLESTGAIDDPDGCLRNGVVNSVWFTYTATESGLLRLRTEHSGGDLVVTTFTGDRGDLTQVADPYYHGCTFDRERPITFPATAGTTYYFMASARNQPAVTLKFTLDRIAPLANDDFADAEPVSLPFSAAQPDFTRASYEPDEPAAGCDSTQATPSVWYTYTPAQAQSLVARLDSDVTNNSPVLGVYEGSSLAELKLLGCVSAADHAGKAFGLAAGRNYHFQWASGLNHDRAATLTLSETGGIR